MHPDIDALVAAGKYAEAAAQARRHGDLGSAQRLYERIWDFRAAAEVARERGDRPDLLRLLLEARDFSEAARVGDALHGAAPLEQTRAAQVYERSRMWSEAAALRERLGELEAAHELYKKAQQPLEAARLDETLGRAREAGIAYERFLADEPTAAEAPRAHLQLGRILAGFQRHDEAARHLQKAIAAASDNPALLDAEALLRARKLLVVELADLGYRDAALVLYEPLRAADARLPPFDLFLKRRPAEPEAATRLAGRYRVERLLGSGGMGRVYLAHDEFRGRDVAVKVVAPPIDERSRMGYQRFMREARVVSSLHHPHIVAVVDFHEPLGLLAMEYMAGGTLADRLRGPLSPAATRAMLVEVLAGLEAAHAHGVIHRDLKPANIFFAGAGEAKLGDFGVAHLQDLGATQTAGFIGTLAYMSPEQISGAPLSFAADVYALGVTAFEALTGRLPFGGPDFVGQHLGERPPPPSAFAPALHPAWDELVLRALAKDPRARHASLEELRHALLAIPIEAGSAPAAKSNAVAEAAAAAPATTSDRYLFGGELQLGLMSATDTRLGRTVAVELVSAATVADAAGARRLTWLRALGRHGGPRVQRILRIEQLADGGVRVVYEAVVGRMAQPGELERAQVAELAAALEPLHAEGIAHGSLDSSILLEPHGPCVLVAGRSPTATTVEAEQAELRRLAESARE
jgi:serine/threonine-protein kinase